ncbi:MAG: hypothetical protein LJE69_09625 [Thiohalocapsa sp.]|uniref:hypothetical protein n=1 Tax=Thiohalocapsa sp. TaxID=2497641 RepID=UPI0025EFB003|nr:hypothetical protein [Thiohalocapsa sp.]MCG6941496.1 hypothetical protein [Thiohalocapsa sp.]
MTGNIASGAASRFSLVVGGPFHSLLGRLRLTGADLLPTWRAALLLAGLAWLAPAVAVVAQSLSDAGYAGWPYFTDLTVSTSYVVAIVVMVVTERYADGRLAILAEHFDKAQLLGPDAVVGFRRALATADRRSSSVVAEAIILLLALAWSAAAAQLIVDLSGSSWEGRVMDGHAVLSWAGLTAACISTPLFLFLVLRWIWRFAVWTVLLFRVSRLPLQLAPLHPDRCAGLGFLSIYPSIFSGFIFALSCVIAAAMIEDIRLVHPNAEMVWWGVAFWLGFCGMLLLGPILVFVPPLYCLREQALIDYGRLASQHHLAFHRKWTDPSMRGDALLGSADTSSASDLNATIEAVQQIRVVPVDWPAVQQLTVAAGAPMLAVVATQIPLAEMGNWVLSKLL